MTDVLASLISGLASGFGTWVILKLATLKLMTDLKAEARIELEEARSQEGYNNISFLGKDRRTVSSREDAEKRELEATISGRELSAINTFIWRTALVVSVMVAVIVVVVRLIDNG
jgi:hypothetical protein